MAPSQQRNSGYGSTSPVLHVVTNLVSAGAQVSTTLVSIGLRRLGWDTRVAFSSRGAPAGHVTNELAALLEAAHVPMYDISAMRWSIDPLHDAMALVSLTRLIQEVRPSIVHTHASKAGILGRLAAWLRNVPHVIHTAHGWSFDRQVSWLTRRTYLELERAAGRITEHTISVSREVQSRGLERGISALDRYHLIRSGIDLSRYRHASPDPELRRELRLGDGPLVGTVARVSQAKAPDTFLAVAERVLRRAPGVTFLYVGGGELLEWMRAEVARRCLEPRVRLLGHRRDVASLLKLMDVFLLTSRWEGLPRSLIEAAAAGIPVVATNCSGVAEVIADGVSGRVAPVGDAEALADAVLDLLHDHGRAQRLAAAARDAVTDDFDIRAVVAQHALLYREMGVSPATDVERQAT